MFTCVQQLAAVGSALRSVRHPLPFLFHPKQCWHHRGLRTAEAFCTWAHLVVLRGDLSVSSVVYIVFHFWFPVHLYKWFQGYSKPKLVLLSHFHKIFSWDSFLISSKFWNLPHPKRGGKEDTFCLLWALPSLKFLAYFLSTGPREPNLEIYQLEILETMFWKLKTHSRAGSNIFSSTTWLTVKPAQCTCLPSYEETNNYTVLDHTVALCCPVSSGIICYWL